MWRGKGAELTMTCASGVVELVERGENVNEVEGAGNTPLHCAAYEGWEGGVELLLSLGAKVNASNNAGDRPWHWARNMGHAGVMDLLERVWTLVLIPAHQSAYPPPSQTSSQQDRNGVS